MLYILEGCDGSGKSTLAKGLSDLLGAQVIHCSRSTPNTLEFFQSILEKSKENDVIADRFCYGQFVYQDENERPLKTYGTRPLKTYGTIYYSSKTALENLHLLESQMLGYAKVVYVSASAKVIQDRLNSRNEALPDGLDVEKILQRYKNIREESMLTWIDWYTGGSR